MKTSDLFVRALENEGVDYSLNHEILNVLLASRTNPRRLTPMLLKPEGFAQSTAPRVPP